MKKIILDINVSKSMSSVTEEDKENIIGVIDYGINQHNRNLTYTVDAFDSKNTFIFGIGPLAGSIIPGTARLVFIAKSPLTETLFLSTIGGAGLPLYHTGIDFVKIEGKSKEPKILVIRNMGLGIEVNFESIESDTLMDLYKKNNNGGIYNLQNYVMATYKDRFKTDTGYTDFRILAVGPSALTTNMGAICSTVVKNGEFVEGVDGWAGRGGFGSLLAQGHNIVAVIYGGVSDSKVFPKVDLKNRKAVDLLFEKEFSKSMALMATEVTEKYRFVKKDNTGGTFGVNMSSLDTWLPMFNWSSVYMDRKKRQYMYDTFVKDNYLAQFNDEIIKTRSWKTCGEPCPALCKKVYKDKKKDYEAYEAFGPNCGIFDQRHAEMIGGTIESMGFDAIGFGNIASFVLECMDKGLLNKNDILVDVKANFNPDTFTLDDSKNHAIIGSKLAIDIAYQNTDFSKVFNKGIRKAVLSLSDKFKDRQKDNLKFNDLANYIPFGDVGYIAPVQYWVPGFYIPLPIQGKFFTYYGMDFHSPEELGKIAADRSIKELYSENTGVCRFHRGWSEKMTEILINKTYGLNINYYTHCQGLLQGMLDYDKKAGVIPRFWETGRVKDIIMQYIIEVISIFGKDKKSGYWLEEFKKDKEKASREYWLKLVEGVNTLLDWKK
ncbi:MAG: hypothetical protein K0B02_01595 [DPANN group archaeon]|nr:hypothetical protein [DPANN group archaeon]